MKTIRVVAAIIKAVNDKGEPIIFATQRGYGEFKDGWEFPGGKIEAGETTQEALVREIMEELDTRITVGDLVDTVEYDYPAFHLSMDCFWAEVVSGDLILKEHEAAKWLTKETLNSVEWLPADIELIKKIKNMMQLQARLKPEFSVFSEKPINSLIFVYNGNNTLHTVSVIDVYDCQIINLSAGLESDIESVRQAVEYAKEKQVLIVASAGNDYAESGEVKHYPAAYESVLAVGSLKEDGTTVSDFSQRGDWVNVYEIGENVTIKTLSGNTKTGEGTSYSAAKVTAEKAKELKK